jgi:hypothetical protein
MAGDWIKMRTALAHDPAVIAIAIDLDKSEFEVVGMLHHLWSWADSQSQDGHIKRVTEVWIDRYVHHTGFAQSMVAAGWLLIEETGITFPSFEKHNGESAKKRAEAAERQRISRENKRLGIVTDLSQNYCDKSVTREEKRREDKDLKNPPTPKQKKPKPEPDEIELPIWLPKKEWADYVEMRRSKKKPVTPSIAARVIKKLESMATAGHNITAALEASIVNCWTDIYEPKVENNGFSGTDAGANRQSRPSLVDQVRQRGREIEIERGGKAGYGSAPDAELPPAWMEQGGIDWDGEFVRVNDADGSLMGADD